MGNGPSESSCGVPIELPSSGNYNGNNDLFSPISFCTAGERGQAAEDRQIDDNNGRTADGEDRTEWNNTIHCPEITPEGEECSQPKK